MSTHRNTSYFNLDHDLRIENLTTGGFILTQSYYDPTEKDECNESIYLNYRKAFSNATDLLHFLEESFGYPIARAKPVSNVHPLPT